MKKLDLFVCALWGEHGHLLDYYRYMCSRCRQFWNGSEAEQARDGVLFVEEIGAAVADDDDAYDDDDDDDANVAGSRCVRKGLHNHQRCQNVSVLPHGVVAGKNDSGLFSPLASPPSLTPICISPSVTRYVGVGARVFQFPCLLCAAVLCVYCCCHGRPRIKTIPAA